MHLPGVEEAVHVDAKVRCQNVSSMSSIQVQPSETAALLTSRSIPPKASSVCATMSRHCFGRFDVTGQQHGLPAGLADPFRGDFGVSLLLGR